MPPKQVGQLPVRDQPGWITFSLDGKHAYPSTGEVIDTKHEEMSSRSRTKGRQVDSEKMLEIVFEGDRPIRTGDQFGMGTKR